MSGSSSLQKWLSNYAEVKVHLKFTHADFDLIKTISCAKTCCHKRGTEGEGDTWNNDTGFVKQSGSYSCNNDASMNYYIADDCDRTEIRVIPITVNNARSNSDAGHCRGFSIMTSIVCKVFGSYLGN